MSKIYAAIDNGVSGSIAILNEVGELLHYGATPVKKSLNYTKKKAYITRLDGPKFKEVLTSFLSGSDINPTLLLERPMIMPGRWKASVSAIRCDEAQRSILELMEIPFRYVDSKEWQRDSKTATGMLPSGLEGDELKSASKEIGTRLFPKAKIKKDADALLMAEFARRHKL